MNYPFSAVTGQPLFKLALTLAAINPTIGGVLVSGPRGSAKSTLARALADLLPEQGAFVTLPLGASEEMLIGTLDLQQALSEQQVAFNPGLLAKAHQGVLYVDEVNLLPDALVDVLLDVAASKVNIIERDGISHRHDADFVLIGTMNPDEGELRPQLQDRFGLCVELSNQYSISERMEIVQRREAFDRDPDKFCQQYAAAQENLVAQIKQSRSDLHQISCPDELRRSIAERCQQAAVEGMRADLVWYRAALAHAAWQQRAVVVTEDIDAVEELVLAHRRQTQAPQQPPAPPPPFNRPPESKPQHSTPPQGGQGDWGSMKPQQQRSVRVEYAPGVEKPSSPGAMRGLGGGTFLAGRRKGVSIGGSRVGKGESGRVNWFGTISDNLTVCHANLTGMPQSEYRGIKSTPNPSFAKGGELSQHSLDWQATPPPLQKGERGGFKAPAMENTLRLRYHRSKTGRATLHLILLDTSASVLTQQAFAKAKGVIMNIAREAYLLRERLSILGFGNQQVQTLLPPIRAPKKVQTLLDNLSAGGGTPLTLALEQTRQLVQRLKRQQADLQVNIYILTDGRISALPEAMRLGDDCVLIDTEQSTVKRGRGRELAQRLNAAYVALE